MSIKKIFLCTTLAWLQILPLYAQSGAGINKWEKISAGVLEAHFSSITTASVTPQIIFLDSRLSIYRSLDNGHHWKRTFSLPDKSESRINQIFASPHQTETIYLATTEGLFTSRDLGDHFNTAFVPPVKNQRNCYSLAFHPLDPDILFLGTGDGLFWSWDRGKSWQHEPIYFDGWEIIKILPATQDSRPNLVMILTPGTLYQYDMAQNRIKRLFQVTGLKNRDNSEEDLEKPERENINRLQDIAVMHNTFDHFLLASGNGILESKDGGKTWISFPMHGIRDQSISRILTTESGLVFCASHQGIYRFHPDTKRWENLVKGLDNINIRDLIFHGTEGGILYTVTSSGAYRTQLSNVESRIENSAKWSIRIPRENMESLTRYLKLEPNIRSVQEAAIRYSDTHPSKFKKWNRDAKLKNLLPKVSGGIRFSGSKNVDIDRGSTNDPDIFVLGPDEHSWSRDLGVSWDLADLIWSENQTSIDSRTKLMAELRNDILSNITRLYFERKRLISEFFLEPPEDEILLLDLSDRIEELTAHLDAYTGGFFSDALENQKIIPPWKHFPAPGEALADRTQH